MDHDKSGEWVIIMVYTQISLNFLILWPPNSNSGQKFGIIGYAPKLFYCMAVLSGEVIEEALYIVFVYITIKIT